MSAVGNLLKETRTKKAVSLDEVHTKIKIHPRVLQLLEDGKFDKLPSPLFAKNFLKSYSDFLGLNTAELVEAYEKERSKDPEQVLFIKSVEERQEAQVFHKNVAGTVAGVVGVVLMVLLLTLAFRHTSAWVRQLKWPAPHVKAAMTKTRPAASKPAGPVKKESEAKRSPDWVRSADQGNFPSISKKTALELRLRALDNVWVRVTADGKVLYQGILSKGAAETWSAKDSFELWTGNAANMYLSLNRYPLGSPGKGMIKKMILSREGVRIPSAQ